MARRRLSVDVGEGVPHFDRPPPAAKLWRYVDLAKYLSLLSTRSLWFARADQLSDPLEGSISRANDRMRPDVYADPLPNQAVNWLKDFRREEVRHIYVSCWHQSDYESAAMWQLYKHDHGIAIVSSYERLKDALSYGTNIYVAKVRYIDYDTDWLPEGNAFEPFVHKRLSFEHEREVRALIWDRSRRAGARVVGAGLDQDHPPLGVAVPTDVLRLVSEVRVSPFAPPWLGEVVQMVTRRYRFSFPVNQSEMATDPVY